MTVFSQTGRVMRIDTPLGTDVLLLEEVVGQEAVSTLFNYTLSLQSIRPAINPGDILGQKVTISVTLPDGTSQVTAGIVRRFGQLGTIGQLTACTAELVPSCWVLTRSTDWRVFSNLSTQDIVTNVLQAAGVTGFRFALSGTYDPREYCAQYGETNMDFISRLLEDEGIYYFFEHGTTGDTIVFADGPAAVRPVPGLPTLTQSSNPGVDNTVSAIAREDSVCAARVTARDFDFTRAAPPDAGTLTSQIGGTAAGKQEIGEEFLYPAGFSQITAGDRRARVRLEASEALLEVVTGTTNCRGLRTGFSTDISGTLAGGARGPFHILQLTKSASIRGAYTATTPIALAFVSNFTAIPRTVPYRPPRVTARPVVRGPQTAIVTGPAGDEIFVDKYGRVKVQFHWDRQGAFDANSSCWIRVSTPMAGKGWGTLQVPRVGQEVVVTFLEGDPDRPLITGMVYNADQTPPINLPLDKTQSVIRTHSTPGGGTADFNEILFEDKKGSELISTHAQRDLVVTVGNNETRSVLHNRTVYIHDDDALTVQTGNQSIEIAQGNQSLDIPQGGQTVTVAGDRRITVRSGDNELDVSNGNHITKLAIGNASTSATLGKISMDGLQSIVLKVGSSSITLDQSGVTISGLVIRINGQVQTQITGLITQVTASATLQMQGAFTMIN